MSRLRVNGYKKMYPTNSNQKTSGAAIVISDKIDFKTGIVTRHKEHFIIRIYPSRIYNIYAYMHLTREPQNTCNQNRQN